MGQCGCNDFQGDFKFKGPDGITYVLQVYQSCSYCETPAGIILYAMNEKDCQTWCVDDIPEIQISDVGTLISVIHPKKLMKQIAEGITVYVEDSLNDEFQSAIYETIKENKELTPNNA